MFFLPLTGDGKRNRDIFRPNIHSVESQKDAMNLVTRKDCKDAPLEVDLEDKKNTQEASQAKVTSDTSSTLIEHVTLSAKDMEEGEATSKDLEEGEATPDDDSSKSSKEINEDSNDTKCTFSEMAGGALIQNAAEGEQVTSAETNQIESNKRKETSENELESSSREDKRIETENHELTEVQSKLNKEEETPIVSDKDVKNKGKIGGLEDTTKPNLDEIEVDDHDDYLLYLEEILKRIHEEFYKRLSDGLKPDMKDIVPAVRKKVLAGTNLVFSGLVPNHVPLEKSRAYQVAISLGANVTQDLKKNTTHLVAVRPGTAKARILSNHILFLFWLYCELIVNVTCMFL